MLCLGVGREGVYHLKGAEKGLSLKDTVKETIESFPEHPV